MKDTSSRWHDRLAAPRRACTRARREARVRREENANVEVKTCAVFISMFDVGRSMFDVRIFFPAAALPYGHEYMPFGARLNGRKTAQILRFPAAPAGGAR